MFYGLICIILLYNFVLVSKFVPQIYIVSILTDTNVQTKGRKLSCKQGTVVAFLFRHFFFYRFLLKLGVADFVCISILASILLS